MAYKKKIELVFEAAIFRSRWLQAPLYAGLIIGIILYSYKFTLELWDLVGAVKDMEEGEFMLRMLTLVDIVMVSNLIVMVIIGGYYTFVSRIKIKHEDKPEWLDTVNAGVLKIKMASSLINISAIHLLQSFININLKTDRELIFQAVIHVMFILSALGLAYVEKLSHAVHRDSSNDHCEHCEEEKTKHTKEEKELITEQHK